MVDNTPTADSGALSRPEGGAGRNPVRTDRVPLDVVPLGGSGVITGYLGDCDRRRLVAHGFVPGVVVSAIRSAPLGDPVEYAVMGSRVALRRRDASRVMVELVTQ